MKRVLSAALGAALAVAATGMAHAADGGWVVKVGAHVVDPKSDNGTLAGGAFKATLGSSTRPTVSAEYLFSPHLGLEVLAAAPFRHTVRLNGVRAGSFEHLPPTVSLQYHFNPQGPVSPFLGVGLNYTLVFNEHTTGPLAGTRLSVGDSFGPAVHAGVDFRLNDRWLFTADARWMNIDAKAKAKVNGTSVGTVHVDPLVYGVAVGYRF